MIKIVKLDGSIAEYNGNKVKSAISRANAEVSPSDKVSQKDIDVIENLIFSIANDTDDMLHVEQIQDIIESELIHRNKAELAKTYIKYRYRRELVRKANSTDNSILSLINLTNEDVMRENSNKAAQIASTQRDLVAGEVSKDITTRLLLPDDIVKANEEGILHFHDADYFIQRIHNCCLVNIEDMLQNGTVINGTLIEKPHSFATACNITTQIMAVVASGQYGGQSVSLSHLAPFVDISRQKFRKEVVEEFSAINDDLDESKINSIAELRLKKEIERGVQTMQYQINTLCTSNGQTPFVTLFMYLNEVEDEKPREDLAMVIEEVLNQRYQGVKNEVGAWISPSFPKLIYVLEEDNVTEDGKYYYLTKLAAKCTAKRLVPDYISEKIMKKLKLDKNGEGHCYPAMGCRSFLTNYMDPTTGKSKYYGRFNQGVVTINLADVGLSAMKEHEDNKDKNAYDIFWRIFEERLELCHKALRCRHERLLGTPSDISPIHWQHGGLARLAKGEPIDKLLYNGYSTLSLGYAGLYECVKAMTGKSHTDPEATPFAIEVMKYLNKKCAQWKEAENIDYSLYGSPIENTTYTFAKTLKKRFGIIKDITDHDYITNSFHVNVREPIDAFSKLTFESQFQALSPGGTISYVEVPNLEDNLDAVMAVIKHIYENIMYAELNTKSDFCQVCGWDREIEIKEKADGTLYWQCPNCGNTDQSKMNVTRRTCGYLGSQFWSQGRTQEIRDRVLHL